MPSPGMGMMSTSGGMSSGMMPNPAMGGGQQMMMPANKRPKVEGQFAGQQMGGMQAGMMVKQEVKPPGPGMPQPVKQETKPSPGAQITSLVETFTKDQIVTYLKKLKAECAIDTTKKPGRKVCPPLRLPAGIRGLPWQSITVRCACLSIDHSLAFLPPALQLPICAPFHTPARNLFACRQALPCYGSRRSQTQYLSSTCMF